MKRYETPASHTLDGTGGDRWRHVGLASPVAADQAVGATANAIGSSERRWRIANLRRHRRRACVEYWRRNIHHCQHRHGRSRPHHPRYHRNGVERRRKLHADGSATGHGGWRRHGQRELMALAPVDKDVRLSTTCPAPAGVLNASSATVQLNTPFTGGPANAVGNIALPPKSGRTTPYVPSVFHHLNPIYST